MGQLKDLLVTGDARVIGQLHANSDSTNGIHIATMDNDSSTATAFVVDVPGIVSLYDGLIIYCQNTKVASASGCTLDVNFLGAKRIWLSQSNGYCTTHWAINVGYIFIYDADNERWVLQQGRDSTTTNATQIQFNNAIKCGSTAIVAGNIIVADSSGLYKHLKLGTAFDITWQILYANGAIAADATSTNVYSELAVKVTTTQSLTLTAYKPLYIKGTLSGTIFTPVSAAPLTQTVSSVEDGYAYIYLGYAYSTTNFRLVPEHPIYAYVDGSFGLYGSSNSNYVKKVGDTMTGDLTLRVSGNIDSPALIFQRGTLSDSNNDWKIYDSSGKLYFAQHDASSWSNVANLDTSGTFTTTKFSGQLSGTIASSTTATTQSQGDNSTKVATTAYVDKAITDLPEPMLFKGSLGTGGTITSLPTAAASNEGFTYKVITAGTYASQAAKVGDTFISTGSEWVLIPSGDEPSGTVTSVTIKATSPIAIDSSSAITTSGTRTLSHATSGVTAGTYRSVTVNDTGHVTAGTNPTTLSGYGITDAKIASGVITLGSNTITPLTSSSSLNAAKLTGTVPTSCYTNTIPSAICETAAATTAKTASCTDYTATAKSFIHVLIRYTNTVKGAITLNINGTGAKPIYINGTAASASNYSLTAGTYIVYYNGTNYYFRTDGKITADGLLSISSSRQQVLAGNGNWYEPITYTNVGVQDVTHKIGTITINEDSNNTIDIYQKNVILSGTAEPDPDLGSNGDIYILLDN